MVYPSLTWWLIIKHKRPSMAQGQNRQHALNAGCCGYSHSVLHALQEEHCWRPVSVSSNQNTRGERISARWRICAWSYPVNSTSCSKNRRNRRSFISRQRNSSCARVTENRRKLMCRCAMSWFTLARSCYKELESSFHKSCRKESLIWLTKGAEELWRPKNI